TLSFDRQADGEPACNRAALSRPAQAIPGRKPGGGSRRGNRDRSPHDAGIPPRPGPDHRSDRLLQDSRTLKACSMSPNPQRRAWWQLVLLCVVVYGAAFATRQILAPGIVPVAFAEEPQST